MTTQTLASFYSKDYMSDFLETWSIRLSPRFMTYIPHQEIFVETKNYVLKTATSTDELVSVFRLRYLNFLETVEDNNETYDIDEFDHVCDHLIIKDRESNEVVGTYRILCSLYTDSFYSEGEFQITDFLNVKGVKLELGRACIDSNHRNGHVIDLLWKGIAKYTNVTDADYLFGCSSVKTVDIQTSFDLYRYLYEKDKCSDEFKVIPNLNYRMDFSNCIDGSVIEVKDMIPPLLRSYLTAGAKIYGKPALDIEFECIDFLTILKIDDLSTLFKRRYFK